jgi:hypothetical protein
MNNKETVKLAELNAKARGNIRLTSEEIKLRNELEFKNNKQNVYMRLTGNNKYYYANQCQKFINYILKHGFYNHKAKDIKSVSIVNCTHYGASINARLSSGGETHIKTFNDKNEMLGFICGFNFKEVA